MAQRAQYFEPTGIQSFTFCPWKYYLEKIRGIVPAYISPALVRGRIGHDILTNGIEFFDEIFGAGIAYYSDKNFPEAKQPLQLTSEEVTKMKEELRVICRNTLAVVDTRGIEILEAEKTLQFSVRLKNVDYPFEGTVDAIARFPDTPEGYVEILDWKFGRKQSNEQLNRNLQHGLYYYALRQHGYKVWRNWWVHVGDFLPYVKNGKHGNKGELRGPGFYAIKIQDSDIPYIVQQVGRVCAKIKLGFFTQNAYGPNAPCPYCEFEGSIDCPVFGVGALIIQETI